MWRLFFFFHLAKPFRLPIFFSNSIIKSIHSILSFINAHLICKIIKTYCAGTLKGSSAFEKIHLESLTKTTKKIPTGNTMKIRTKRTRALQLDERRTTIGCACFITVLIGPAIARDRNSTFFFLFSLRHKKTLCTLRRHSARARSNTCYLPATRSRQLQGAACQISGVYYGNGKKKNHTHTGSG